MIEVILWLMKIYFGGTYDAGLGKMLIWAQRLKKVRD